MGKRLFDLLFASLGLSVTSPLLLFAVLAVKLSSRGPVFYRAPRVGLKGRTFVMYKIRTMRFDQSDLSDRIKITSRTDKRVFAVGQVIRKLKLDELPQLFNVVTGDMSLVGPRPEDPDIVRRYYSGWELETLNVRPGIASPGSLFNYTHGHLYIDDSDPETSYVEIFLPRKLALDMVYIKNARVIYDFKIIWRTVITILLTATGKRAFHLPPEAADASRMYGLDY